MKTNNYNADEYLSSIRENNSFFDNLNEIKDNCSTQTSSNISVLIENEKPVSDYFKITSKSMSYIFPLVYFFTSTLFLFIILFLNIFKDHNLRESFEKMPLNPFPSFYLLKQAQPKIFSSSILIISISGFLNVWFFCSLLLQRFSVPELKQNKLTVHLMFILGIFGNIMFIFFGFSPELLKLESEQIKILRISLSMVIFISFVFFNTLFASLTLMVFENFRKKIAYNDKRIQRNIRIKKYVVYLTIFICFVYLTCIFVNYFNKPYNHLRYHHTNIRNEFNFYKYIQILLFIIPYFLFVLNALINLTYYFDIRYVDDVINMIIDREFFLEYEDSSTLIAEFHL
jgi:hypothetical protein